MSSAAEDRETKSDIPADNAASSASFWGKRSTPASMPYVQSNALRLSAINFQPTHETAQLVQLLQGFLGPNPWEAMHTFLQNRDFWKAVVADILASSDVPSQLFRLPAELQQNIFSEIVHEYRISETSKPGYGEEAFELKKFALPPYGIQMQSAIMSNSAKCPNFLPDACKRNEHLRVNVSREFISMDCPIVISNKQYSKIEMSEVDFFDKHLNSISVPKSPQANDSDQQEMSSGHSLVKALVFAKPFYSILGYKYFTSADTDFIRKCCPLQSLTLVFGSIHTACVESHGDDVHVLPAEAWDDMSLLEVLSLDIKKFKVLQECDFAFQRVTDKSKLRNIGISLKKQLDQMGRLDAIVEIDHDTDFKNTGGEDLEIINLHTTQTLVQRLDLQWYDDYYSIDAADFSSIKEFSEAFRRTVNRLKLVDPGRPDVGFAVRYVAALRSKLDPEKYKDIQAILRKHPNRMEVGSFIEKVERELSASAIHTPPARMSSG